MRSQRAACAFSTNALLQWQIMFYSRESVIARWTANIDRYPAYVSEVDRALASGERVAVVGYVGFTGGLENLVSNPSAITEIDRKYFVYLDADRPLLERAGFRRGLRKMNAGKQREEIHSFLCSSVVFLWP
jgi:hypothetical protein